MQRSAWNFGRELPKDRASPRLAELVQCNINFPRGYPYRWEASLPSIFSVGQFVRFRKLTGGIYEVVRVLPLVEDGAALYLLRSTLGAEAVARHHELEKA